LDGFDSESQRNAVKRLQTTLGPQFPSLMLEHYRRSTRYRSRLSCVYYTLPYCRWNEDALQLGIEGSLDRSKHVRYRSFQLLALSQNARAVKHIDTLLESSSKGSRDKDLLACHAALIRKNINCFPDRNFSGMVFVKWTEILPDGSQREVQDYNPCKGQGVPRP
jgi:hypothetical protein